MTAAASGWANRAVGALLLVGIIATGEMRTRAFTRSGSCAACQAAREAPMDKPTSAQPSASWRMAAAMVSRRHWPKPSSRTRQPPAASSSASAGRQGSPSMMTTVWPVSVSVPLMAADLLLYDLYDPDPIRLRQRDLLPQIPKSRKSRSQVSGHRFPVTAP